MSFEPCSICGKPTELLAGTVAGRVPCSSCRQAMGSCDAQQQPVPAERMLDVLNVLRELSVIDDDFVTNPRDRHAVILARALYSGVRAVDVDKLHQRALF